CEHGVIMAGADDPKGKTQPPVNGCYEPKHPTNGQHLPALRCSNLSSTLALSDGVGRAVRPADHRQ
ncbi:hypothetical protein, partial [Bradyrhizobium manausense]|uniref:hypothetical protein n=1 Tax=Bradyrhizobium manausense TaxID=989370 RepID=UPI001BABCB62